MNDTDLHATLQNVAVIGKAVYRFVNTPEMVGTEDETGYVLLFFNAKNHRGKFTLISSAKDGNELRMLLEAALKEIGGPKEKYLDTTV